MQGVKIMKLARILLPMVVLTMLLATTSCGLSLAAQPAQPVSTEQGLKQKKSYKDLIVGYVQLGDESEWRSANTASVRE